MPSGNHTGETSTTGVAAATRANTDNMASNMRHRTIRTTVTTENTMRQHAINNHGNRHNMIGREWTPEPLPSGGGPPAECPMRGPLIRLLWC